MLRIRILSKQGNEIVETADAIKICNNLIIGTGDEADPIQIMINLNNVREVEVSEL